jgi:hypothetical protein
MNSLEELFTITCGVCHATAPVNDWCNTLVAGALPRGEYQCPFCQHSFRRERDPKATKWYHKFIRLTPTNPYL